MKTNTNFPINSGYLCLTMVIFNACIGLFCLLGLPAQSSTLPLTILLPLANIIVFGVIFSRFYNQHKHACTLSEAPLNTNELSLKVDHKTAQLNQLRKTELSARTVSKNVQLEVEVEQAQTIMTLKDDLQLLSAILDSTAVAIYAVDNKGLCIFANPQCALLLGYSHPSQLLKSNMQQLVNQRAESPNTESSIQDLENIKEDIFWKADGSSFPVEYNSQPLTLNSHVNGAVISFYDNSERREAEELIRRQAHYDTLTDLPNRFLALKRLEQLVESSERSGKMLAVIFLDLDDFKKINDSLGHEAGDLLLITASERLLKTTRAEDTVGRLGGDEFIILLDGLSSANDAQPIAENLIGGFRKPFYIDNRQLILTASIGIAIYPNDGETPSELLRNADSAMYHTKSIGRNTYSYFTHAMNKEVSRRLAIEEQIHGALERGEIRVHYQIQLDIRDGSIMGAEALLRWNNPTLGSVSPAEFIPIAEQTGMIEPMGEFVLQQALETAHIWQRKFNDKFRVAINLSPRQFRNPKLVQTIIDKVEKLGMHPSDLELEITEGVLLSGHAYTLGALMQLSEAGFYISMDDFGTGYSSLSYLKTYPFTILKIDRSFIHDMNKDDKSNDLIIATIEMAHALGIRVIAEGVETQEQLDELSFMMCDYAQGFLISKPVPLKELLKIGSRYRKMHEQNTFQGESEALNIV
ncbi:diguanylate cyclase/phosphodiesterase with PAS/PAC sensor(s) [Shewanella halifaxensis HAW-EB4]|uniref:Diguanylate cyclase/phosphodiesterase with PAS/PAC sensor(S) n=1 Tax=Shewanella halifaxensis (strain HAW-EB4) TaxID=458817 RepID=B0TRE4_SHEHH|nr:EAL domain-containing protein [Shewanella halifaxensis]ABZ75116.1 diguanylate cyclase/phosphodiesterase with PAS/PAC sensor(s) [Shewanella halifaxensis HAW-EB4]